MRVAAACVVVAVVTAALAVSTWTAVTASSELARVRDRLEQRQARASAFRARMMAVDGLADKTSTSDGTTVVCRTRGSHANRTRLSVVGRVRPGDVFVQVCRAYAAGDGPAG